MTVCSASEGQQAWAHPVIVALRSSNFAFSASAGQTPAGGGGALRGGGGLFLGGGGFFGAGAVFFGVGLGVAFGEGCTAGVPGVDRQRMCSRWLEQSQTGHAHDASARSSPRQSAICSSRCTFGAGFGVGSAGYFPLLFAAHHYASSPQHSY